MKTMLPLISLAVPLNEGLKGSRPPFSPYPRSKSDDQRLLLPRQVHSLIIPARVRFIAKLHIEVPYHTRKNKSRFEITKAVSTLDTYTA